MGIAGKYGLSDVVLECVVVEGDVIPGPTWAFSPVCAVLVIVS